MHPKYQAQQSQMVIVLPVATLGSGNTSNTGVMHAAPEPVMIL
jgi:hypothetical protein